MSAPELSKYATSLESHIKQRYLQKIEKISTDPLNIPDDFNTKLCRLLRMSVDNNALGGRTGFPVSQTLASKSKLLFMFATVLFVF